MKEIDYGNLSIIFWSEGKDVSREKKFFPESFFKNQILTLNSSGNLIFKVCGLFFESNQIYVIFPKEFRITELDDEKLIKNAYLLIQVLQRYNTRKNSSVIKEGISTHEVEESGSIFSLINILKDYISHGNLVREVRKKEFGYSGRVDWRQTIKKSLSYISEDTIHYIPPVITKKFYDRENIIQKIHRKCVAESFEKFGWIFGLDFSDDFYDISDFDISIEEILHILNYELRVTFFDRDIYVIKLMIEYFEEMSSVMQADTDYISIYTFYFQNIFEAMCMDVLSGTTARSLGISKPKWNMKNGDVIETSQIPDVIFVENDELYIVDAKYYSYLNSLPGWGDLVKQHFYGFAFEERYLSVHNLFLLPGTHDEMFEYIGYSDVPDVSVFSDSKIYALTVDCRTLMSLYVTGISNNSRAKLVEQVSTIQPNGLNC